MCRDAMHCVSTLSTFVENVFFYCSSLMGSCTQNNNKRFLTAVVSMKYTQNTLDKIEKIAEESGYVIRYERGNFQSGYCILQEKRVVVLNKFLQTEGRINTLVDLMPQLNIHVDSLTHESQKMYDEVMSLVNEK
ncbi:MAG: hypothetical protein JWP81_229 [Ferruginibacter sp.]|nr:hypothetical protein [Ferruginibacter sp.]